MRSSAMWRHVLLGPIVALFLSTPADAQPDAARVLVVPFENADKESVHQWLGEAAAVLLADGLRERGVPALGRAERVGAFDQLHLPLSASLSRATIIKVGQLVGARDVIVGTFKVQGEELAVSAHTIRVEAGRVQPLVTEKGPLTDLFAIFERLGRKLSPEARGAAPKGEAPPLVAFENYIKGLLAESPSSRATFLESAIRESPSFDRARLALWEVRTDQADHLAALETVGSVAAGSPFSRRARFAAGVSLLELTRYDEAFDAFKSLLDKSATMPAASNAPLLNNLGIVQIRRGVTPHTAAAAYYLTKAAEADPDPDYLFNLGYAYVRERNHQGAIYWLREALRRDPADADAHFVLAAALHATGSSVEATREGDLARQLSARYEALERSADRSAVPDRLERLAVDIDLPRPFRADQGLGSSAQREQRELAAFHLAQGRRLFEREQDREAMIELKKAVYLSPYEAEAHLLIGRIHLRGGRPAEAIDALKIAIWSGETAPAHVALAEAHLKAGNNAEARKAAERALALDPASEDAKRLLGSIRQPSP